MILTFVAVLFSVVSYSAFNESISANISEVGVKEKITDLSNNFLNDLKNNELNSVNNNFPENHSKNTITETEAVYIGGFPIGIKIYCDGVIVVDTADVETTGGVYKNPAKEAGLLKGDIIKTINGEKVNRNSRVSEIIEKSNGQPLKIQILRNGEIKEVIFSSVYSSVSGQYKAGLWIRDSSAGIGTVTFLTEDGRFASLGHAVCDVDTGEIMPVSDGETTDALITGFYKGKAGNAGELCGILDSNSTGKVAFNDDTGVYGIFNEIDETKEKYDLLPKEEVKIGAAQIVTTVENGSSEIFNVQIERIDYASPENKNLVIRVTDQNLINKTGGIIQGMSGSPIIQEGKLVGAVTHVFLNDPTGGYGIFAETMLQKVKQID